MKHKGFFIYILMLIISTIASILIALPSSISISVAGLKFSTIVIPMILMGLIVILVILFILIDQKKQRLKDQIYRLIFKDETYLVLLAVLFFVVLECAQDIIFLKTFHKPPHYQNYLLLLNYIYPLLLAVILFSLVTIVFLFIIRSENDLGLWPFFDFPKRWVIFYIVLVSLYSLAKISGYGFIPYTNRQSLFLKFGDLVPTSVPVIGLQVGTLFGVLLCSRFLFRYLIEIKNWNWLNKYGDIILIGVIWVLAFVVWIQVPIESNSFIDVNLETGRSIYPISDAFYYDKEAFHLLDAGKFSDSTTHVFYSFLLAVLHRVAGPGYMDIIWIQVAILAFIPVMLYKLASLLHSKFSGLLIAALFILRERNGLLLSDDLSGTLVNQLMTEPITLLFILLFLYNIIAWLKSPDRNDRPLIAGAVIGITMLIRAEIIAVLSAVLFGAVLCLWESKKVLFKGVLQIVVVAGLIVIPWMGRNYVQNGVFSIDKGNYIQRKVAAYISNIGGDEQAAEIDDVDDGQLEEAGITSKLKLKYIPNQFISSAQQSILVLPVNFQPLFTLASYLPDRQEGELTFNGIFSEKYNERYVKSAPYFWYSWDGDLETRTLIPIAIALLVIAVGLGKVWELQRSIMFILPLAMISHFGVWAFASYSGGRFIKPSDWIPMFFYCIGLVEIIFVFLSKITSREIFPISPDLGSIKQNVTDNQVANKLNIIFAGIFLVIGLLPLMSEIVLPDKYQSLSGRSALVEYIEREYEDQIQKTSLIDEIENPEFAVYIGKSLYPRYFDEGDGYDDDRKGTMPRTDRSRVDFFFIGESSFWVSLPLMYPEHMIDHYSDVVIIGDFLPENANSEGEIPYFEAKYVYSLVNGTIFRTSNINQ